MKYGRVKERRADVWIYLTRTTQTLIFHSYRLDGEPDGVHIVDEILEKAKPCFAFKLAKTPLEILALATYYFIRKGLAANYDMSLTPDQANLLSALCKCKRPSKVVILRLRYTANETPKAAQESDAQSAQEPNTQSAQASEEYSSRDTSPVQTEEAASLPTANSEIQQLLKVARL